MQAIHHPSRPRIRRTALALALCGALACAASLAAGPAAPASAAITASASPATASQPVAAGDDFFLHINGAWLDQTEIPADRRSWGAFAQLSEETNQQLKAQFEALAADPNASGEARKIVDYYNTILDEAAIEAKGLAPLKPLLDKIAALRDKPALARHLGAGIRADVDPLNNSVFFTENLFGLWVTADMDNPKTTSAYLLQGGLGMPDRAYYLDDTPRMQSLRAEYRKHVTAMLTLAGFGDAEARAGRIIDLETKIATSHSTAEESNNISKSNNRWAAKDFAAKAPGLDWAAYFKAANLGRQKEFIVWHPAAFKAAAALVASTPLSTWQDWLAFHTVNHFARVLPRAFTDQHFAFYGKAMTGTPQQIPRWRQALNETDTALGDAVGKVYVARHFPAESKARVQRMADNILEAFHKRIGKLDWMEAGTKAEAQAKVKGMYVGIGHTDKWQSYSALKVERGDALGNLLRSEQFLTAASIARLGKTPNRKEWSMTPQTVNAVNLPIQNAINFPAAFLRPPFFDPKASDAVNYGSLGATIGHEISHGFDDMGAQFDAHGKLRNWWSAADEAHFKKAGDALVAQYSAYKPFPDLAVNGQLTLGENLADLAGLSAAYDAYRAQLGPKANLETDREFFTGYAQSWRTKQREQSERSQVLSNGHALARYRTATVRNLDAWYKAFDVQPGQKLYLAPEQRVRVW